MEKGSLEQIIALGVLAVVATFLTVTAFYQTYQKHQKQKQEKARKFLEHYDETYKAYEALLKSKLRYISEPRATTIEEKAEELGIDRYDVLFKIKGPR